jgi:hypothetical protein
MSWSLNILKIHFKKNLLKQLNRFFMVVNSTIRSSNFFEDIENILMQNNNLKKTSNQIKVEGSSVNSTIRSSNFFEDIENILMQNNNF